jgi:hypothetical protein
MTVEKRRKIENTLLRQTFNPPAHRHRVMMSIELKRRFNSNAWARLSK